MSDHRAGVSREVAAMLGERQDDSPPAQAALPLIDQGDLEGLEGQQRKDAIRERRPGRPSGSRNKVTRAALQHLVYQRLQLMADPTAPRSFARMEARAAKDYGQQFWWRPGEALPGRAPDLTATLGGH